MPLEEGFLLGNFSPLQEEPSPLGLGHLFTVLVENDLSGRRMGGLPKSVMRAHHLEMIFFS